ncbi:MAG: serine/threonine protein kinase, partial [Terrabacter sp.]|nr:serine/threonine protein kinase [Terrabacter sp.]
WEAWDERLQRRVAVKQLHPQPGLSADEARIASERALREARNAARLHHPNAVPVYDVVDHDGQPCLVMQYLPARSLQALLAERGTLDVSQVARIGTEVASALEAAHQVGIVHRDVKPGNVLIDAEGSAKLTDFGISHSLGDPSITATGLVTGTPAFLAPEVARGAAATPASDVFSLGSMLYTALEGTSPFGDGQNAMATLHRAASGQITPPQRSGPLTPLLGRMLAVDPADRPSMSEVTRELRDAHRASLDPAAFARTQQLTQPARPPTGPPPSSTVVLPPVVLPPGGRPPGDRPPGAGPAAEPERRRNRGVLIAGLIIAALILGGLAALVISQAGDDGGPAAGARTTSAPATHSVTRKASRSRSSSASTEPTKQAPT